MSMFQRKSIIVTGAAQGIGKFSQSATVFVSSATSALTRGQGRWPEQDSGG
jgi:hypothetical protein